MRMICNSRFCLVLASSLTPRTPKRIYLESLVLQDSLDCGIFTTWRQLGLEDDTERAISNNLALSVGNIPGLTSRTVLNFFSNDLYT